MKRLLPILAMCISVAGAAVLAPVNPDASPKAKAIYTYLQDLKGKGILSGQEAMLWDSTSFDNWTYSGSSPYSFRDRYVARQNGGSFPAIYESDFGDVNSDALGDRQRVVDIIKARAPKGTLFMLNWHATRPDEVEGNGGTTSKNTSGAAAAIDKMLQTGSTENVEWFKRLDAIAGYLKQLRDSNIVVLWRPFHENNGNFFWWGQQARFKELWRQMYDRFARHHNLYNLLWVYNSNHFDATDTWVRKNYPGDSLVDIVSVDIYTQWRGYNKVMWDTLNALANGKPVGIAENGTMPDVNKLFSEGQQYVFYCTWFGFENPTDQGQYGNNAANYTAAYGSSYTVTEDELAYTVVPDGKYIVTAVAGAGGSVAKSTDGRVATGTIVTLTAAPAAGYDFVRWEGGSNSTANPLALTVTSDVQVKAVFQPGATTNLLKDGDFTTSSNWVLSAYPAGDNAASVSYAGGKAQISISKSDKNWWSINLFQKNIGLDSGATYVLTFAGSAASPRTIHTTLTNSDWKEQDDSVVELTSTPTAYSVELTSGFTSSTSVTGTLQFNVGGGSLVGVTIDDVKLVRKSTSSFRTRVGTSSQLGLRAVANGFEWTRTAPLASAATVRVIDTKGRELYRTTAKAGNVSGFVPSVGSGLRFVVLEGATERDVRSLTSTR